jgi:folate-binding protein YgfZ
MTDSVVLSDRGIVEVAGPDATKFLHNLVTNDIASLSPGEARFAGLLSPQGKILFDFLVFARDEEEGRAYLLDCPRALVPDLVRRLSMYKMRAQLTITDRSEELASMAFVDGGQESPEVVAVAFARDPRSPELGWRGVVAASDADGGSAREKYEKLRIEAGVPQGGVDFIYGDAFPHEANMDLLSGLDFKKGCYIGQEVVSRMKHRGTVRKRVTPFSATGPAPAPGTPITVGELEIGVTGSSLGEKGLALIRLDRLEDARSAGAEPLAGGVALEFATPTDSAQSPR